MAVKFPTTRYQGSKTKFMPWIWENIKDIRFNKVLDAFGGTGCFSHWCKCHEKYVNYNDILPFNYVIGKALIENDTETLSNDDIEFILHRETNHPTFIQETFNEIYYTDDENEWLDNVSFNIRHIENEYKRDLAYFALFQACLIKRPYNLFHRKNLDMRLRNVKRSFGNKKTWDTPFETHFRKFVNEANNAVFNNGNICISTNNDIFDITRHYDLVYLDPPYLNENGMGVNYSDFYHFLNGLVDYDNWKTKIDYTTKHLKMKSNANIWNNKETILEAFKTTFNKFKDSIVVLSYRNNGFPSIDVLLSELNKTHKNVQVRGCSGHKYALSKNKSNEVLMIGYN